MDIVYYQPLKELLQVSSYFKEQDLVVLVSSEAQEKKVKAANLIPCYVVSEKDDLNKFKKKKLAALGGSVKANEFAVKAKADFLLQPSNTEQFFDLGLAKKLADKKISVVMMLEEMLSKNSFERHKFWKNYLEVVNYCKRKNAPFFVASGCKEPLNIRPRKVRKALAETLGLPAEDAKKFLEMGK